MTTELQILWNERLKERLKVSQGTIADFCNRWKTVEFALFGSVLRDDFCPYSDIDVLIRFVPKPGWNLFHLMDMQRELEALFGREVDLLEKRQLQNPFRRAEILKTHRVIYTHE